MSWKPLHPPASESEPIDLGTSLDRLGESLGVPSKRVLRIVFGMWDETVGAALALHAQPLSIRDGTLVVEVTDSTWATELRWLAPELLEKLSSAAGQAVAARVEVRVTKLSSQPGAQALGGPSGRMGSSPGSAT